MVMKWSHFMIFVLSITLITGTMRTTIAGPGDTIAEAYTAVLGQNNGSVTLYNEVDHYNFSATSLLSYNFTLYLPDNDYVSLYIYDSSNTLIASNFTSAVSKSLIIGGYDTYIIKVISSEFIVAPAAYSLIIEEIIGQPKDTIRTAEKIIIGSYTDVFNFYNEVDWYNFTGQSSKTYNFTVSRDESAVIYLSIYDKNMQLIKSNWTTGPLNQIVASGYVDYTIQVASSEFITFPVTYTLTITDITPVESTTTTDTSTPSTTSPEVLTITESLIESNNPFSFVDFPWLLFIPVILGLSFIKKYRK